MADRVHARRDPQLTAQVIRRVPMQYAAGADPDLDRPGHVRAASGLAWMDERLAVVQDDAHFVALVDPATGEATAVPLPPGPGGLRQFDDARGNKADKLDLEAIAPVPGADGPLLLLVGSGSTARREHLAVIGGLHGAAPTVALHHAPGFFAGLRGAERFAGSELNIEGAIYVEGRLRLFGRGNGAARGVVLPMNATCEVDWRTLAAHLERPDVTAPPAPAGIVQYDLGALGGVPLGFTDAALAGDRRVIYTAAAEASPDATRDGPVMGSAIGVIEEGDEGSVARWTELSDREGRPLLVKIEGVALVPGAPGRAFVAVDRDEHDQPSELCEVALGGPW